MNDVFNSFANAEHYIVSENEGQLSYKIAILFEPFEFLIWVNVGFNIHLFPSRDRFRKIGIRRISRILHVGLQNLDFCFLRQVQRMKYPIAQLP